MAEDEKKNQAASIPDGPVFPPYPAVPTFAVDYVPSVSYGIGNVKFYMCRLDSELYARETTVVPVLQAIMPNQAFAHMVVFFDKQLENMIERGLVSKEEVENMRQVLSPKEAAPDAD
ncbi:MAG: hypothetical protein RIC34_00795 [Parvibaculum sp.]|uniref:hypothetical protein n=1 Tax=Parvibaculum sp. TaxID=2024848 RepID=UPI0032EC29D9